MTDNSFFWNSWFAVVMIAAYVVVGILNLFAGGILGWSVGIICLSWAGYRAYRYDRS